jgi:oligopeptide transport system permease protein
MFRFIAIRVLQTIPVLLVVATLTFFLTRAAPGGPFSSEKAVTPEAKRALEAHYGLDRPLLVQYASYLGNLVQGDLGPSMKYQNRSVNELIAEAFPNSLKLGACSLAVALVFGLGTGLLAAIRQNRVPDYAASSVAMVGICLPTFVLGPLLILLFALRLGWFNASGWFEPRDMVLPSLTLGIAYAAYVTRLTRAGMIEVLSQDFIRTARAKGASETRVLFKHALRSGILPVISFLGPATAGLVTGSFVVESIFQIPGLGRYFVTASFNRDYTMVLGTVLFYATLIIVLNLVVDVVQVLLNPKMKFE